MPEQAHDRQAADRQATDRLVADADATDAGSAELVRRLLLHDADAPAEILARSATSTWPGLLVAAAILAGRTTPALDRAQRCATTTRDRQLVALAAARLGGDAELLDALARDHLADYPDHELAAWIADPAATEERA